MKPMLYANWLQFRQLLRSMLLVVFCFCAGLFLTGNTSYLYMMSMMIVIMVPSSLEAQGKLSGWEKFSLTMPITRRKVIGSKFLFCALVSVTMFLFSELLCLLYSVWHEPAAYRDYLIENAMILCVLQTTSFILTGFFLTVSTKWGIEKARYILVACVWLPLILLFALGNVAGVSTLKRQLAQALKQLEESPSGLLALGILAVGLLIYWLCYQISVHIYQKTEM